MSQFQNYAPSLQTIANQESSIQRQIEGLTQQLQQMQNIKNQMMQNIQTYSPQQKGMTIQTVESFDNISANSVPMDNGTFFISKDGKEIQYRHWNDMGQIVRTSYFPQIENNPNKSAPSEEKSKIGVSDEVAETFQQQFNELMDRLDTLEDIVNNKPKRSTRKKESVVDVDESNSKSIKATNDK